MGKIIYSHIHNVDSGLLGVFSTNWIKRNKGLSIVSFELKVDTIIKFRVLDTWRGTISCLPKLLKKGAYYVGDPGYIFIETWYFVLIQTDYFKKIPSNCIRANTGGDGAFTVEVIQIR
jgi:hypothetical protein